MTAPSQTSTDNAASSQHGSDDTSHEQPSADAVTESVVSADESGLPPAGDDVITDAAVAVTGEPPAPNPELAPRDL
jgi:hypothetical protein